MAYGCQYSIDRGVNCTKWVRPGEDGSDSTYCTEHEEAIKKIDTMWAGITHAIKTARQDVLKKLEQKLLKGDTDAG